MMGLPSFGAVFCYLKLAKTPRAGREGRCPGTQKSRKKVQGRTKETEKHMEQSKQAVSPERNAAAVRPNSQSPYIQEIDLVELFFTLLRNWKLLVLGAVVGVVVSMSYYSLFVHPQYKATTEMYITNTDTLISLSDLQLGSALTEDYKSIIKSRAVLNKVIEELELDIDYKKLGGMISVSNPSGTHIIKTAVTTGDEESCRLIANELLNVSIERIFQVIGTSEPTIIDHSEAEAVENITPGRKIHAIYGVLFGVLLVAAFITLSVMMDTTLKNEDDVRKYLKLPLLASVPYFSDQAEHDNK